MSTNYRSEIDGLRALAIVPVIMFHASVPGFGGGFVGVDVFFVISGYLIAKILVADVAAGQFSFSHFYERRVRRIIPALFFVLFVSLAVGYIVLDPTAQVSLGKSLIAALLFVSNIFFYRESGYFDSDSELKPLLHTWSLGVEEQFYIFFPLLVWAGYRLGVKYLYITLVCCLSASLMASHYAISNYPSAGFYLLPTRTWELLMGALLACLHSGNIIHRPQRPNLYAALGLAMIALSIIVYSNRTPFPGLYALPPALGTLIFIHTASSKDGVGKFFSTRIVVRVGLLSYGLYLWHQPILAYSRILTGHLTVLTTVCSVLLTTLMAWISWRFIERPFRGVHQVAAQKLYFLCASSLIVLMVIAGLMIERAKNALEPVQPIRSDHLQRVNECFLVDRAVLNFKIQNCIEPRVQGRKRVLLIGDSHAASLYPGLRSLLRREGVDLSMLTAAYCLPIVTSFPKNESLTATSRCAYINLQVQEQLQKSSYDLVLISGNIHVWGFDKLPKWTYQDYFPDYLNSIKKLKKSGIKLAVIGQFPILTKGLPNILAEELGWNQSVDNLSKLSASGIDEGIFKTEAIVSQALKKLDVPYLSVLDAMCTRGECERFGEEGEKRRPFAIDYGHLSIGGSNFLAKRLKTQIMIQLCEDKNEPLCQESK